MHRPSSFWKKNQGWLYTDTCYLALSQFANQPWVSAQLAKHVLVIQNGLIIPSDFPKYLLRLNEMDITLSYKNLSQGNNIFSKSLKFLGHPSKCTMSELVHTFNLERVSWKPLIKEGNWGPLSKLPIDYEERRDKYKNESQLESIAWSVLQKQKISATEFLWIQW